MIYAAKMRYGMEYFDNCWNMIDLLRNSVNPDVLTIMTNPEVEQEVVLTKSLHF